MRITIGTVRMGIFHMVIGAASFWLPDILIKVFTGNRTAWPLLTAILPTTCFGVYFLVQRAIRAEISVASWTLAGIYFFGPLFMLATATLQGGGPHTMLYADYWFIPLDMILPPLTLLLSGYDQSFFALMIVTIGFAIIRLKYEPLPVG
jgi:hypothetical protein